MRIKKGETTDTRDERILRTLREHAPELVRLARRLSLSPEDAQDGYQRALEIYVRRVESLDPATERGWLFTVVKHECLAVRAARMRRPEGPGLDPDEHPARIPSPEDHAADGERLERVAEALRLVKQNEAAALILRAHGLSYEEIAERMAWTGTKVNRCIAEGRRRFLRAYAEIEAGEQCRRIAPLIVALAEGIADPDELAAARPHLRGCPACRARIRELHTAPAAITAVFPVGLLLGSPDAVEAGSSMFTRAYEALTLGAHKLYGAVELLVSGKAAVAVASAAAVAGGSAVVVERAADRPAPQVGRIGLEHGAGPSGGVSAPRVRAARAGGERRAAGESRVRGRSGAARGDRAAKRRTPVRRDAARRVPMRAVVVAAPAPTPRPTAPRRSEFGGGGGTGTAAREFRSAPATAARREFGDAPRSRGSTAGVASGEFASP